MHSHNFPVDLCHTCLFSFLSTQLHCIPQPPLWHLLNRKEYVQLLGLAPNSPVCDFWSFPHCVGWDGDDPTVVLEVLYRIQWSHIMEVRPELCDQQNTMKVMCVMPRLGHKRHFCFYLSLLYCHLMEAKDTQAAPMGTYTEKMQSFLPTTSRFEQILESRRYTNNKYYVKRCKTSFVIKEIQINITRDHYTSTKMPIIFKIDNDKC